MSEKEQLNNCILCGSANISIAFESKDFMITGEEFSVCVCHTCQFHFTSPRPFEQDLSKYYEPIKYLSHSSHKFSLVEWLYSLAKKYTLRWKLKKINQFKTSTSNISLLDIGCGNGDFLRYAKKNKLKVTGVESSDVMRENVNNRTGITIHKSIDSITVDKFDIITLWHVLEHIYALDDTFIKIKSLLQTNGIIFVALPNRNSADAIEYNTYWAGWDVPRHIWHFSKNDIHRICEKHGLNIREVMPMKLDAYYVSMLSERYKRKNQNLLSMLAGFYKGLISNIKAGKNQEYSSLLYVLTK
jgi:SAM-dependent methyltransferase